MRFHVAFLHLTLACAAVAAPEPLKPAGASASSSAVGFPAALAVDGDLSAASSWKSGAGEGAQWLEIDLGAVRTLAGLHLFSGSNGSGALRDFTVQFRREERWEDVPSAMVAGNQAGALALKFDDAVVVTTDRIRLWITHSGGASARVSEVVVWPASLEGVPPLSRIADRVAPVTIFLNQSGFNAGEPKRFTVPGLADGTRFEIRPAGGGEAVFAGEIHGQIGDFTAFEPADAREYVVAAEALVSVPFRVGQWWLERVTYQGAVDFMIDSRHYVGNDRRRSAGSYGWRDDHHYGWELTTLVPQWLSNPSAYARMPRQIRYEPPVDPALWGKLQPPAADAPDLVKLIHWGADVIVTQGTTHELLKAQLAYFLYAWPALKAWLPAQNYEVVRDFAFARWGDSTAAGNYMHNETGEAEHDLFALKTHIGTTKGGYPPGFSVEPNLLMYEVAKREGRPDADRYFEAARRQVDWMVANLDWELPLTTKGQRMSEFVTMTGMAHFLAGYPDRAPAGLEEKINAWAAVVVRRSDNLWDFRKLGDGPDQWTPMGEKPSMWNEPGNVVGLPAAILAARPFVTDAAVRARLDQIMWAHFDAFFGRNPAGRHFSYAAPKEIEGVEFGWYSRYPGGNGRLEKARFVIDGSPKNPHFPFHPEAGNVGWTEGWIEHNTPFNLSLAYLAHHDSAIALRRDGAQLVVRLRAPLNFDYAKVETATVSVTSDAGDQETLTVTEESPDSRFFTGRLPLGDGAARPGDGILQGKPGDTIETTYGFGYFGQRATLTR